MHLLLIKERTECKIFYDANKLKQMALLWAKGLALCFLGNLPEKGKNMADNTVRNEIDKEKLIDLLTEELPSLRAKIGVSQEELSDIVGISRPTFSAIETKKRKMSWNVYLSLLMCFTQNEKTAPIIEAIGAFPDELRETLNINNRR